MQKVTKKTSLKLPKCEWCGVEFIPSHHKQKYCRDAHRQAAFQKKKKDGK